MKKIVFTIFVAGLHLNDYLLAEDILLTGSIAQNGIAAFSNLNNTVIPYPIRKVYPSGSIVQGIVDRKTKVMPSTAAFPLLAAGNFSVLPAKPKEFENYPAGAVLFKDQAVVATSFDQAIAMLKANPEMIAFCRKIHLNALHELYHYLMSIYFNFNLQHAGVSALQNGSLVVDIPLFLQDEKKYGFNTKILIINHLMNIIQSQLNNAFCAVIPKMPQMYACYLGKTVLQNDFSFDLTLFATKNSKASVQQVRLKYLTLFGQYLSFFQNFTNLLQVQKKSQKQNQSFSLFEQAAENINQFLYAGVSGGGDPMAVAITKMNPVMLSFSYDDIRALKIIPYLAKKLSGTENKIGYPEQIVQAAQEGIVYTPPQQRPHPIAYFRTSNGTVVAAAQPDAKLYISVRTGQNLFEEALTAEPDWLGSWNGIVQIMKGCFGDCSALLGLGILDPLMEYLVAACVALQKGSSIDSIDDTACLQYIAELKAATQVPKNNRFINEQMVNAVTPSATSAAMPTAIASSGNGLPLAGINNGSVGLSVPQGLNNNLLTNLGPT